MQPLAVESSFVFTIGHLFYVLCTTVTAFWWTQLHSLISICIGLNRLVAMQTWLVTLLHDQCRSPHLVEWGLSREFCAWDTLLQYPIWFRPDPDCSRSETLYHSTGNRLSSLQLEVVVIGTGPGTSHGKSTYKFYECLGFYMTFRRKIYLVHK